MSTATEVPFSGRVVTTEGVGLPEATLIAWPPSRSKSKWSSTQRFATDHDGCFSGSLDRAVFRYEQLAIDVHDGTAIVFRGLVQVGDDILLRVESSTAPASVLSGRLVLSQARAEDKWIAFLHDADGRPLANSGVNGPGIGRAGDIVLRLAPWDRDHGGEVSLSAFLTTGRHRRGTVGVKWFRGLTELEEGLRSGVVIDSFMRGIRVDDVRGRRPTSLGFRTLDRNMSFHPWTDDDASDIDTQEIALPPGRFFVKGYNDVGEYGVATLRVGSERIVNVSWELEGPGSGRIRLVDGGYPDWGDSHVVTYYRIASDGVSLLYGDIPWTPGAPPVIEGLVAGRYRVQGWGDGVLVSDAGFVEAVEGQERTYHLESVIAGRAGSVFLEFANLHELGLHAIDFSQTQIWHRVKGAPDWKLIDTHDESVHGGVIGGLPVDTVVQFAIAGDWWSGTAEALLGENTATARVRLEPAFVLEGLLITEPDAGLFTVRWTPASAKPVGDGMPWTVTRTASRFRLLADREGFVQILQQGTVMKTVSGRLFSKGPQDILLR